MEEIFDKWNEVKNFTLSSHKIVKIFKRNNIKDIDKDQ